MLEAITQPLRRQTRRGAVSLVVWSLVAAWSSLALYLALRIWLVDAVAAILVAAVIASAYGIWRLARGHAQRSAPPPPPVSDELLAMLKVWVRQNPWAATGLAAGLGYTTAREGRDPAEMLEQVLQLIAGLEAAQSGKPRPPSGG